MSNPDYLALRDKLDAFSDVVTSRRRDDLACRPGCDACCHVQLEVSDVEAQEVRAGLARLEPESRARVRARSRGETDDACVMLEPDGRCAIYASRPLVCRSQGHALRYPPGTMPEATVCARADGGEITWCPLCYRHAAPAAADVLDAERVDVLLALVNGLRGGATSRRTALRVLAAE